MVTTNQENGAHVDPASVSPDAAAPSADTSADVAVQSGQDEIPASTSSGQDNSNSATQPEAPTLESVVSAALAGDPTTAKAGEAKAAEGETGTAEGEADTEKSDTEAKETGEGDDLPDDPTEAELAEMKQRASKRVMKLLSQRNNARRELDALKPDADGYRAIRTYMDENNLADNDVANLFRFGAHLRAGRFDEAFAIAAPFMKVILEGTGRAIPEDLRGRVDTGEMSEDAAKQVARERYARVLAEQKVQRSEQNVQQVQTQVHAEAVRSATAAWEANIRATDLDFDLKAEPMKRFAVALVAERGLPKTPAEAVEYAQRAYDDATEFLRKARPAPKSSRPAPSPGVSNPRSAPVTNPASLQDAILAGLTLGARG